MFLNGLSQLLQALESISENTTAIDWLGALRLLYDYEKSHKYNTDPIVFPSGQMIVSKEEIQVADGDSVVVQLHPQDDPQVSERLECRRRLCLLSTFLTTMTAS